MDPFAIYDALGENSIHRGSKNYSNSADTSLSSPPEYESSSVDSSNVPSQASTDFPINESMAPYNVRISNHIPRNSNVGVDNLVNPGNIHSYQSREPMETPNDTTADTWGDSHANFITSLHRDADSTSTSHDNVPSRGSSPQLNAESDTDAPSQGTRGLVLMEGYTLPSPPPNKPSQNATFQPATLPVTPNLALDSQGSLSFEVSGLNWDNELTTAFMALQQELSNQGDISAVNSHQEIHTPYISSSGVPSTSSSFAAAPVAAVGLGMGVGMGMSALPFSSNLETYTPIATGMVSNITRRPNDATQQPTAPLPLANNSSISATHTSPHPTQSPQRPFILPTTTIADTGTAATSSTTSAPHSRRPIFQTHLSATPSTTASPHLSRASSYSYSTGAGVGPSAAIATAPPPHPMDPTHTSSPTQHSAHTSHIGLPNSSHIGSASFVGLYNGSQHGSHHGSSHLHDINGNQVHSATMIDSDESPISSDRIVSNDDGRLSNDVSVGLYDGVKSGVGGISGRGDSTRVIYNSVAVDNHSTEKMDSNSVPTRTSTTPVPAPASSHTRAPASPPMSAAVPAPLLLSSLVSASSPQQSSPSRNSLPSLPSPAVSHLLSSPYATHTPSSTTSSRATTSTTAATSHIITASTATTTSSATTTTSSPLSVRTQRTHTTHTNSHPAMDTTTDVVETMAPQRTSTPINTISSQYLPLQPGASPSPSSSLPYQHQHQHYHTHTTDQHAVATHTHASTPTPLQSNPDVRHTLPTEQALRTAPTAHYMPTTTVSIAAAPTATPTATSSSASTPASSALTVTTASTTTPRIPGGAAPVFDSSNSTTSGTANLTPNLIDSNSNTNVAQTDVRTTSTPTRTPSAQQIPLIQGVRHQEPHPQPKQTHLLPYSHDSREIYPELPRERKIPKTFSRSRASINLQGSISLPSSPLGSPLSLPPSPTLGTVYTFAPHTPASHLHQGAAPSAGADPGAGTNMRTTGTTDVSTSSVGDSMGVTSMGVAANAVMAAGAGMGVSTEASPETSGRVVRVFPGDRESPSLENPTHSYFTGKIIPGRRESHPSSRDSRHSLVSTEGTHSHPSPTSRASQTHAGTHTSNRVSHSSSTSQSRTPQDSLTSKESASSRDLSLNSRDVPHHTRDAIDHPQDSRDSQMSVNSRGSAVTSRSRDFSDSRDYRESSEYRDALESSNSNAYNESRGPRHPHDYREANAWRAPQMWGDTRVARALDTSPLLPSDDGSINTSTGTGASSQSPSTRPSPHSAEQGVNVPALAQGAATSDRSSYQHTRPLDSMPRDSAARDAVRYDESARGDVPSKHHANDSGMPHGPTSMDELSRIQPPYTESSRERVAHTRVSDDQESASERAPHPNQHDHSPQERVSHERIPRDRTPGQRMPRGRVPSSPSPPPPPSAASAPPPAPESTPGRLPPSSGSPFLTPVSSKGHASPSPLRHTPTAPSALPLASPLSRPLPLSPSHRQRQLWAEQGKLDLIEKLTPVATPFAVVTPAAMTPVATTGMLTTSGALAPAPASPRAASPAHTPRKHTRERTPKVDPNTSITTSPSTRQHVRGQVGREHRLARAISGHEPDKGQLPAPHADGHLPVETAHQHVSTEVVKGPLSLELLKKHMPVEDPHALTSPLLSPGILLDEAVALQRSRVADSDGEDEDAAVDGSGVGPDHISSTAEGVTATTTEISSVAPPTSSTPMAAISVITVGTEAITHAQEAAVISKAAGGGMGDTAAAGAGETLSATRAKLMKVRMIMDAKASVEDADERGGRDVDGIDEYRARVLSPREDVYHSTMDTYTAQHAATQDAHETYADTHADGYIDASGGAQTGDEGAGDHTLPRLHRGFEPHQSRIGADVNEKSEGHPETAFVRNLYPEDFFPQDDFPENMLSGDVEADEYEAWLASTYTAPSAKSAHSPPHPHPHRPRPADTTSARGVLIQRIGPVSVYRAHNGDMRSLLVVDEETGASMVVHEDELNKVLRTQMQMQAQTQADVQAQARLESEGYAPAQVHADILDQEQDHEPWETYVRAESQMPERDEERMHKQMRGEMPGQQRKGRAPSEGVDLRKHEIRSSADTQHAYVQHATHARYSRHGKPRDTPSGRTDRSTSASTRHDGARPHPGEDRSGAVVSEASGYGGADGGQGRAVAREGAQRRKEEKEKEQTMRSDAWSGGVSRPNACMSYPLSPSPACTSPASTSTSTFSYSYSPSPSSPASSPASSPTRQRTPHAKMHPLTHTGHRAPSPLVSTSAHPHPASSPTLPTYSSSRASSIHVCAACEDERQHRRDHNHGGGLLGGVNVIAGPGGGAGGGAGITVHRVPANTSTPIITIAASTPQNTSTNANPSESNSNASSSVHISSTPSSTSTSSLNASWSARTLGTSCGNCSLGSAQLAALRATLRATEDEVRHVLSKAVDAHAPLSRFNVLLAVGQYWKAQYYSMYVRHKVVMKGMRVEQVRKREEEFKKQLARVKQGLRSAVVMLSKQKKTYSVSKQELTRVSSLLQESQFRETSVKQQLQEVKVELESKKKLCDEYMGKIASLTRDIDEKTQLCNDFAAQIDQLRTDITALEAVNAESTPQYTKLEAEYSAAQRQLREVTVTLQEKEAELVSVRVHADAMSKECAQQEQQLEALRRSLGDAHRELEHVRTDMRREKEMWVWTVEREKRETSMLRERLEYCEKERDEYQKKWRDMNRNIRETRDVDEENEKLWEEVRKMRKKIREMEREEEARVNMHELREKERVSLEQQNTSLRDMIASKETLWREKYDTIVAEHTSLQRTNDNLALQHQMTVEKLESKENELRRLNACLEDACHRAQEAEKQCNNHKESAYRAECALQMYHNRDEKTAEYYIKDINKLKRKCGEMERMIEALKEAHELEIETIKAEQEVTVQNMLATHEEATMKLKEAHNTSLQQQQRLYTAAQHTAEARISHLETTLASAHASVNAVSRRVADVVAGVLGHVAQELIGLCGDDARLVEGIIGETREECGREQAREARPRPEGGSASEEGRQHRITTSVASTSSPSTSASSTGASSHPTAVPVPSTTACTAPLAVSLPSACNAWLTLLERTLVAWLMDTLHTDSSHAYALHADTSTSTSTSATGSPTTLTASKPSASSQSHLPAKPTAVPLPPFPAYAFVHGDVNTYPAEGGSGGDGTRGNSHGPVSSRNGRVESRKSGAASMGIATVIACLRREIGVLRAKCDVLEARSLAWYRKALGIENEGEKDTIFRNVPDFSNQQVLPNVRGNMVLTSSSSPASFSVSAPTTATPSTTTTATTTAPATRSGSAVSVPTPTSNYSTASYTPPATARTVRATYPASSSSYSSSLTSSSPSLYPTTAIIRAFGGDIGESGSVVGSVIVGADGVVRGDDDADHDERANAHMHISYMTDTGMEGNHHNTNTDTDQTTSTVATSTMPAYTATSTVTATAAIAGLAARTSLDAAVDTGTGTYTGSSTGMGTNMDTNMSMPIVAAVVSNEDEVLSVVSALDRYESRVTRFIGDVDADIDEIMTKDAEAEVNIAEEANTDVPGSGTGAKVEEDGLDALAAALTAASICADTSPLSLPADTTCPTTTPTTATAATTTGGAISTSPTATTTWLASMVVSQPPTTSTTAPTRAAATTPAHIPSSYSTSTPTHASTTLLPVTPTRVASVASITSPQPSTMIAPTTASRSSGSAVAAPITTPAPSTSSPVAMTTSSELEDERTQALLLQLSALIEEFDAEHDSDCGDQSDDDARYTNATCKSNIHTVNDYGYGNDDEYAYPHRGVPDLDYNSNRAYDLVGDHDVRYGMDRDRARDVVANNSNDEGYGDVNGSVHVSTSIAVELAAILATIESHARTQQTLLSIDTLSNVQQSRAQVPEDHFTATLEPHLRLSDVSVDAAARASGHSASFEGVRMCETDNPASVDNSGGHVRDTSGTGSNTFVASDNTHIESMRSLPVDRSVHVEEAECEVMHIAVAPDVDDDDGGAGGKRCEDDQRELSLRPSTSQIPRVSHTPQILATSRILQTSDVSSTPSPLLTQTTSLSSLPHLALTSSLPLVPQAPRELHGPQTSQTSQTSTGLTYRYPATSPLMRLAMDGGGL